MPLPDGRMPEDECPGQIERGKSRAGEGRRTRAKPTRGPFRHQAWSGSADGVGSGGCALSRFESPLRRAET